MWNESNHHPRCLCTCGDSFPLPWPSAETLTMVSSCHDHSQIFSRRHVHVTCSSSKSFSWCDGHIIRIVGVEYIFPLPFQVLIKKLRLDMFTESELNGANPDEDNVRRGIHDEEPVIEEPPVDIFDELLGQSGFPTSQPATVPAFTSLPSAPTESTFVSICGSFGF